MHRNRSHNRINLSLFIFRYRLDFVMGSHGLKLLIFIQKSCLEIAKLVWQDNRTVPSCKNKASRINLMGLVASVYDFVQGINSMIVLGI